MAQRRAVSTGQNSSHEETLVRELWPPHRVHTRPDAMEPAVLEPVDSVDGEAEREQLGASDHPMLSPRQRPGGRLYVFGVIAPKSVQAPRVRPRVGSAR